ncbi:MAG TPA: hypothetical protein PLR71_03680, partial [Deltaproteobacteria bacterium]|nr:hypothetical protein [Deltaproteobacteria bacterium]
MNSRTAVLIAAFCLGVSLAGYTAEPDAAPMETMAAPAVVEVDQTSFFRGYEFFKQQDYAAACPEFHRYVSTYTPDAPDYEWAEFFLGVSLMKLGYTHAATGILARVVARRPNPRIVEYSLEVFESVSRSQPHDRELIVAQTVCDHEFGYVEGALSDFVHYHQGVYDWEHGFMSWGDEHFARITPQSRYYYQYLNRKALLRIHQDRIEEAVPLLRQVITGSCTDENLKDQARKTLARLLYEQKKYAESDLLYQAIEENILAQSQNLMERAWAHYRMGNPEKAMGLLYAFEAPSYRNHLTPEYYMLKSFIYKDVCHYQSALNVVNEFKGRYGSALAGIYQRGKTSENSELLLLILNRKAVRQTWDFLQLLEQERARCGSFRKDGDDDFFTYLDRIYALQIEKETDTLKTQVEEEYEKYADDLLRYEEEAHLMAYEIGLDMYQRVSQYHYAGKDQARGDDSRGVVVYPFQGEFWNDELA